MEFREVVSGLLAKPEQPAADFDRESSAFRARGVGSTATIWLYGQHDAFYSIAHSRDNFAAFEKAGGRGKFFEVDMPVGQGHFVIGRPKLWSGALDTYLSLLAASDNH